MSKKQRIITLLVIVALSLILGFVTSLLSERLVSKQVFSYKSQCAYEDIDGCESIMVRVGHGNNGFPLVSKGYIVYQEKQYTVANYYPLPFASGRMINTTIYTLVYFAGVMVAIVTKKKLKKHARSRR